uniref:Trehalose 6-phosphate phosphatase n=1 Tax=Zea mays TaxID=4577 RepID=Q1W5S7_MAIZE|nr:sister of ramosa 3 [Zea mays]
MTKRTAFAADDAIIAAAAAVTSQPGRRFTSYPPARARGGCRLAPAAAARQATDDPGAAGSWPELVVPRHADFDDWMEKHPSALAAFESVLAAAKGKKIVMFLDYDGTLSPIVRDPDSAVMSEEMRDAVRGVAEHFPTAIVSGRCRDKVFNFVKLAELYYAGSHGMDIKGPTAQSKHTKAKAGAVLCQPARAFLPVIEEVYRALTASTAPIPGATVENNKFCLSVHFRCVQEEKWRALEEQVRSVLKEYPDLRLTKGRKVLEIRPSIKWDKGNALQFLLESLGFAGSNSVFPIYIGDDSTDEDAFKVLRNLGQGIGILVSKIPKETRASYSLREPSEVEEFLRKLVSWSKESRQRD